MKNKLIHMNGWALQFPGQRDDWTEIWHSRNAARYRMSSLKKQCPNQPVRLARVMISEAMVAK